MKKWGIIQITLYLGLLAGMLISGGFFSPIYAQNNSSAGQEVYLTLQYQGIVSVYVTAYYKDDSFYLPVDEVLNVLKIPHKVNQGTLSITGTYPTNNMYKLNFNSGTAFSGDTKVVLKAEDFLIKDLDYFIKPKLFKTLLGLNFTTDFGNLTLDLTAQNKLPVVQEYKREQDRKKINRTNAFDKPGNYPLKYDRTYATLDGAFLDYNLSFIRDNETNLFFLNNNLGFELLGGDLQGNTFASVSDDQQTFTTDGLRWRYVRRNNPYFSSAIIGQTQSDGVLSRSITGFKISNEPVEPRTLFDQYVIQGDNIPPQSEVELYLNNRLVDYQEADIAGNYRFVIPLTYGNTNYSVRIYTPSGQSIERNARIQIPFDYLPEGEVDYNVSAGRLENPILGNTNRGYVSEATISAGLTRWLTAKGSTEYLTAYHNGLLSFTGTLNARLFSNYLVSASINPKNFYRLSSSVVYNSGASWNVSYSYNPGDNRISNIGDIDHEARLSFFTPIKLGVPLNLRLSSSYRNTGLSELFRYRADLNSRFGKLNVRLGYRDQQIGDFSLNPGFNALLTNSYSYSVGRYNQIPRLFRGMFIRSQLSYLPKQNEMEEINFQLSRNFLESAQLQVEYQHNFVGDFSSVNLNVSIDFNKVRTTTSARIRNSSASYTQNLRGSVGYYPKDNDLLLQNRQQVGQSGAAVRLFVDNNNDGIFQDSTDQVISDPAVKLNRSGGRTEVKNGINYITRLLPYYRYDLEINKAALSNPLLVPDVKNFSIVTDPDQYKTIEIPFYQSGVISGKVQRLRADSSLQGLGGVRLYLKAQADSTTYKENFEKEIRTFSEGSFYTYEVPPGLYDLYIDPDQLNFLKAVSRPDTMQVEIKALSQGDFKEGLQFTLVPKKMAKKQKPKADTLATITADIKNAPDMLKMKQKLSSDVDQTLRLIIESQNAFYNNNFPEALRLVNRSLALFETAEGYALKGSLQYLRGDKVEAQKSWEQAKSFNPDIYIPDTKTLDQRIKIKQRQ